MTLLSVLSGVMEWMWKARSRGKGFPDASQAVLPDHRAAAIRNSTWMLASRLASQVFAAALTVIVARGLGEAGLGQYAFIASLLMIANVTTTFGTDTYLIREIAARPGSAPGAVNAALAVQLLLSGLVILACWTAAKEDYFSSEITEALFIFSFSLVPLAFYSVFSAVLRAREQMYLYMLVTLMNSGLQAAGTWVVISLGGGLIGLAYLTLAASTSSSILAGYFCSRSAPGLNFSHPTPLREIRKTIRLALPLALLTGIAIIYQRSSIVMLAWLAEEVATGWYSASFRVVEVSKIFHLSVLGGLFPLMASLPLRETGPFLRLRRWVFLLLIAASLSGAIILTISAPAVINLVYGGGFGSSIPVLQTQAWILLPYAVTSHQSLVLVVRGQERWVLLATVLALVLLIGLNLVLIPGMGAAGAARASLAAETGLAILLWTFCRWRRKATDGY